MVSAWDGRWCPAARPRVPKCRWAGGQACQKAGLRAELQGGGTALSPGGQGWASVARVQRWCEWDIGVRSCVRGCHQALCVPGTLSTALWAVAQEGLAGGHWHFCLGWTLTLAEARTHPRNATESSQVHTLQGPLILSLFERGAPPHSAFRVWRAAWTPLRCQVQAGQSAQASVASMLTY